MAVDTEADILHGLDFGATLRDVTKGLLVKPILHNYLYDAEFPDFDVKFRNQKMHRDPDGFFHPSTHPLWKPGALLRYITRPAEMPIEKMKYMNTLSVTIGTAFHGFVEVCLEDAGIRPKDLNVCTVCPRACPTPKGRGKAKVCGCRFDEGLLLPNGDHLVGCTEPGVLDMETGSRGHMDGLLDLSRMSIQSSAFETPTFEFKTFSSRKAIDDLDLDDYKRRYPTYYAQNQEYMRMSGRRMCIVLFMFMGFPWEMTEIHVPYDAAFAGGIRQKYLDVRQAAADQTDLGCCSLKGCPAWALCRVDQAKAEIAARASAPRLAL